MELQIKVFYSWQSDSDKSTNLNGIRSALRLAANNIEANNQDIRVEVDEATRDTPGSPNIPQSIFNKIENCDVFVCDLTTINPLDNSQQRKVPNPNVLIELGFAIAKVGWERIIMLFNTSLGNFPKDLPFDIDRHRASPYEIKDSKDKNGKSNLSKLLTTAIQEVIKQSPKKPDELKQLDPSQIKRKNDLKFIEQAFSQIHIQTFDKFFERYPDLIIHEIFDYKEAFLSIIDSKAFHIYDTRLRKLIDEFRDLWIQCLSFAQHYGSDSVNKGYKFYFPDMMSEQHQKAREDFDKMYKISQDLNAKFSELLKYIRENYLEIDLDAASENPIIPIMANKNAQSSRRPMSG